MEIKQLQLEILEAERLIDRNKMILALNDELISTKAELKVKMDQEAACLSTAPEQ